MLKKIAFGMVIFSGLLFMSCDPEEINEKKDEPLKNYWERTAWNYLQLKGRVKSIKETDNENSYDFKITFGEDGRILKTESSSQNQEPYVINFEYNRSGQLIKDEQSTYKYGTHGKYIPRKTSHMHEAGLVKNLVSMNDNSPLFKFEGDNLLMIWEGEYADTTTIQYTGKYPTKIGDVNDQNVESGFFMNASYQPNGIFKIYEEGFFSTGENWHIDSRKYHYKEDDEFMLLDKEVISNTTSNPDHNFSYVTQYTYNEKKDLIKVEEFNPDGSLESTETYEYKYDAKGNWIKSTYKYSNNDYTSITNREIEYFD